MLAILSAVDFKQYLETYGYIAILIGTFLEGETIVIVAGFLAQKGYFYPPYIALCAFTGSFISDQLMFCLGRYKGKAALNYFPRLKKNVRRASVLIRNYETALILGFRFIYGVRNVTPILLGAGKVSHLKFFTLNFIGGAIWAASFTAGGFYFGEIFSHIVEKYGVLGMVAFLLVIGGLTFFYLWRRKKRMAEKTQSRRVKKHSLPESSPEQED